MNRLKQQTKERIVAAALDLFCVNGYTTVSVRDIGKAVGIKESSIYYHFKNKQEILQTILQQAEQSTQVRKNNFNHVLITVSEVDCEKFIAAGISYIEDYLLHETVYKLIRMLTIEKQRNEEAAVIYHNLLFTAPLEHQQQVFSFLMENELIRKDHQERLAAEYQSIILFIFQKYFAGALLITPETRLASRQELTILLQRFFNRYFYKGEQTS